MPRKPSPVKAKPRSKSTGPKPSPRSAPAAPSTTILDRSDVRRILSELAMQIAPADLTALMGGEPLLRVRAANLTDPHLALFRNQVDFATGFLRDHVDNQCPQIPYYTVSLLGAALLYFADEFDAIPDFLPHLGSLDDAVVMAMACELGAAGLRRYCAWKGLDIELVLPPSHDSRSRPGR